MIFSILSDLEEIYPASQLSIEERRAIWEEVTAIFGYQILELGQTVTSSIIPAISPSIMKRCKEECLCSLETCTSIAEYRIRPSKEYFTALKKELPVPEAEKGPHAVGCEFSISLYASYDTLKKHVPAEIEVKFEIWGHHEQEAFRDLYRDYRRPIQKLIQGMQFDFHTAVAFDNVDQYKGKDTSKKLDLYYANIEDPEHMFSMAKVFNVDDGMSDLITAAIPLFALYACSFNYANKKQNKDEAWKIFQRVLSS